MGTGGSSLTEWSLGGGVAGVVGGITGSEVGTLSGNGGVSTLGCRGLASTALINAIFSAMVKVISSESNISDSNVLSSSMVARIDVSSSNIVVLLASICSSDVWRVAVFLSLGASSLSRIVAIFP